MRFAMLAVLSIGILLGPAPAGTDVLSGAAALAPPEIQLAGAGLEVRFEDAIGRLRQVHFPDPSQRSIEIGVRPSQAGAFVISSAYAWASPAEHEARAVRDGA